MMMEEAKAMSDTSSAKARFAAAARQR